MNREVLIDFGSQLAQLRNYPLFDMCHYLSVALQVRDDIHQSQTVTPNFARRHPFSCWLSTVVLCFSGSLLSNFLLGETLLKDFFHHQHLLLATVCWYFVFYSPLDLVGQLLAFLPVRVLVGIGKEIHRTKKIYEGVHQAFGNYPEAYIVVVILGAIRGCAETVLASFERYIRGVWLPNQHEFLFPSFATKACLISSVIFLLSHLGYLPFERELIYLCIASMFIYVRVITSFFKQYDPFLPFENLSSGLLFSSWSETVADAYRRATAADSAAPPTSPPLPSIASSSSTSNTKKETALSEALSKALDGKK